VGGYLQSPRWFSWAWTVDAERVAKSVFHFDVQGSVAKSTQAGIPWLRFIRRRLGARVHFWPFDGWDIPTDRSAIAEVYPSLWRRGLATEGRTPDQHDAFCFAEWLTRADRDGTLACFLKLVLSPAGSATRSADRAALARCQLFIFSPHKCTGP
jgi:hypothetical protein